MTQFEDLNLVNADATDETKTCHDKICPWILSRTIVILSASTNRPYESFAIKGNQPDTHPTQGQDYRARGRYNGGFGLRESLL